MDTFGSFALILALVCAVYAMVAGVAGIRTQHPQPVIAGGSGSGLDATMWRVLLVCWAALISLMVLVLRSRYELEKLRHEVAELSYEIDSRAPLTGSRGLGGAAR